MEADQGTRTTASGPARSEDPSQDRGAFGLVAGLGSLLLQGAVALLAYYLLTDESGGWATSGRLSMPAVLLAPFAILFLVLILLLARKRHRAPYDLPQPPAPKPGAEAALDPLASMSVRRVMITDVRTVPLALPFWRLLDLLYGLGHGAGHDAYPVVTETGRLVGIVTRGEVPGYALRDVLGWLIVADVMSSEPLVVADPGESVRFVLDKMHRTGVYRLPVVDREFPDQLLGFVTPRDLLEAFRLPDALPTWDSDMPAPPRRRAA
jgi:CBS domain-containing protein